VSTTPHPHRTDCSGCPRCNSIYAALLAATPAQAAQFSALRMEVELRALGQRVLTTAAATNDAVPDPPDLVAIIQQRARNQQRAPQAPQPETTNAEGVPDAPDLVKAIQQSRRKG
jgi:hypothetical protein